MIFGLASAILPELSFEELVTYAQKEGLSCLEIMCWPKGKAERRYAGVTHIDIDTNSEQEICNKIEYAQEHGITISALAYYPNPLDEKMSNFYINHIKKLILVAEYTNIGMVNTFIGRDPKLNIEENFKKFVSIWTPIIEFAELHKVKIAIENCPMLFTLDEWPGGCNLATTPALWRRMFEVIPSKYFGLNYDPSHFIWLRMDYIKPIFEFRDRIFHVHFKDIKLDYEKLDNVGIMATPLEYIKPKIPGLGDVNWSKFISALTDINYQGAACIEIEDKSFERSLNDRKKAIRISKNYLLQFIS